MSTPQLRAPKRRIEKIRNRINTTISNSQADLTLHIAEDSKTLVRIIVALEIMAVTASIADYHMVIQKAPQGVLVVTPTISQALEVDAAKELLLEKSGRSFTHDATSDAVIVLWEADSRAMRKLVTGDKIFLNLLGDVASSFSVCGHITLFFKE